MHTVTSGLEDEIAAEAKADQAFIAALTGRPITPQAAPVATAPTAASATPQDYSLPARLEAPQDPPGWERIYEGSFLEAVHGNTTYRRVPRPGAGRGCHCPSTRRIANASLSREARELSVRLRP